MNHTACPQLNTFDLIAQLRRPDNAHKGLGGKVLLIGGAHGMMGALLLAGRSAALSGAGWTVLMMLDAAGAAACALQPELMIQTDESITDKAEYLQTIKPSAVAIGTGLGNSSQASEWLETVLYYHSNHSSLRLVVDADALNLLAHNSALLDQLQRCTKQHSNSVVITPHAAEAARLLKTSTQLVENNRLQALADLVNLTGAIVVLKGHHTLIASPQHSVQQCVQGNPSLAVGGMGDVLTGLTAALASQGIHYGLDLWQAACLAVELHATAADQLLAQGVGPIGLTPSELILAIRSVMNQQINLQTELQHH